MTGEEIRRIIESDYEKAKILLEQSRIFRVTAVNENEEPSETDERTAAAAIDLFERQRDVAGECYLDVTADAVEFNGRTFQALVYGIADKTGERLLKDKNYITVQQFNRDFIAELLKVTLERFSDPEARIASMIVAELIQVDYPI